MKYKDIFTNVGVFSIIKEIDETLYNVLFTDTDSTLLDVYAKLKANEKTVTPLITDETTAKTLLTAVCYNYSDNWKKIKSTITTEYNAVTPNKNTETETYNESANTNGNSTNLNYNKAFNSEKFVENEQTENSHKDDTNRDYTRTKTTATAANDIQNSITQEISLREQYNFINIVLTDILNNITLKIYE